MKRKIYVLSSTHWDREWYETFQQYRFRLVRFVDDLIETMEKDPEYKFFHFDGQTIILEDYLRIRPENKTRLSKLIQAGRILIGPWYCMPDEFLLSGEALVRNLQEGHKICGTYNVKSSNNGYVCDIFGHNSQMPQIFDGFDIHSATLMRGIGDYKKDCFVWQGADGTQCLTHKLHPDYTYSSFFFVVRFPFEKMIYDDIEILDRVKKYLIEEADTFATSSILMIDGVDHIDIEPELPRILKLLNTIEDYEFIHSNFEDYLICANTEIEHLEKIKGSLYNIGDLGHNNRLLKNVLSSQVHLKQANDYCESNLSLVIEPLDLFTEANKNLLKDTRNYKSCMPRHGFIGEAWKYVFKNQPHDSICGCSITETHMDNEYRYKQAKELIGVIRKDILIQLANNVNTIGRGKNGALLVVNPSQVDIDGIIEIEMSILAGSHQGNFRLYDVDGEELNFNIIDYKTKIEKNSELRCLITMPSYDCYTLAIKTKLMAYSYKVLTLDILMNKNNIERKEFKLKETYPPKRNLGSLRLNKNTIDNGKLIVKINSDGTLNIINKATGKEYRNILLFEDCADIGDGWNYIKPPFDSEYLTTGCNTSIAIENDNPLMVQIRIIHNLMLPNTSLMGRSRSSDFKNFVINSIITIKKDSNLLNIKTVVENSHTNHRLRVSIPTYFETETFKTSTPFDLSEWDIKSKISNNTIEVETYVNPNQGILIIGDMKDKLALYNKGLYEIEVTQGEDKAVMLTLFRSFPNEVGRQESNMGKMLTTITCEYGLEFLSDDADSDVLKRSNLFKTGILTKNTNNHEGLMVNTDIIVDMTGSAILSALNGTEQLADGTKTNVIRLYDVEGGGSGKIKFKKPVEKAWEINLKGDIIKKFNINNGIIEYKLGNRKIISIAFTFK